MKDIKGCDIENMRNELNILRKRERYLLDKIDRIQRENSKYLLDQINSNELIYYYKRKARMHRKDK